MDPSPGFTNTKGSQRVTVTLKEWATIECINRYRSHIRQNRKSSLRACIKHINSSILREHSSEHLTYQEVHGSLNCTVGHVHTFPNYVYFQIMSQRNHSLSRRSQLKLKSHHPPADMDKIKMEICFMPKRQTAYVVLDLPSRPHGTEYVANKSKCDKMLSQHSIPQTTIVCGGKHGVVNMMNTCGAIFFYPNYVLLKELARYCAAELALIQFVVSGQSELVVDKARSSSANESSVNKRIRFGFGQNQPESNTKFRTYIFSQHTIVYTHGASKPKTARHDTLNLPTMNTAIFHELPRDSRNFIVRVAECGHKMIRKYCGSSAMKDKLRHKLFTQELNTELGYPSLLSRFEYFDIYVTTQDVDLNRHMDVSFMFHWKTIFSSSEL